MQVVVLALLPMVLYAADPQVGQPAPQIRFEKAMGSAAAQLQGKAVALEFWATTCSLCISAIPHWNELARQFRDQPITFLSITDEDPVLIERFLKDHPIEGLVAIAKDLKRDYGVEGLPRTFLIDADGKLAANLYPWALNAKIVEDLIARRPVVLPKSLDLTSISQRDSTLPKPIVDAIIRPASDPEVKGGMGSSNEKIGARNGTLKRYLAVGYGMPMSRIVGSPVEDVGLYDISVSLAGGTRETTRALFREVLCASFHIKAEKETRTMDALVLSAPNGKPESLIPAQVSTTGGMMIGGMGGGAGSGRLRLQNVGPAQLATVLESELGKPVVDETGISGIYNLIATYD